MVTNRTALLSKYGRAGLRKVLAAVSLMKKADRTRGIETKLIFLDDPGTMKRAAVTDTKSGQQHKVAVDAVYAAHKPHYLVILDGPDVVPHVALENPVRDDDEGDLPSDLPYACDASFGRDARRFITVTRVVGRIPGITNAKSPGFLVRQIRAAARFRSRPRQDYLSYLALSTAEWRESSARNVGQIFGAGKLLVSPPVKAPRTNRHLRALTHFINCHGGHEDTRFYGELRGERFLVALSSRDVLKHAKRGTLVAAECCFGAELYDPRLDDESKQDFPISIAYLDRGAIGFVGSTTTAYAPVDTLGAADLIMQYFLISVLDGASLGRAFLQARQQFVLSERLDDKTNLKTLGQFILLGDPSVHPCVGDAEDLRALRLISDPAVARANRRSELIALGKAAGDSSLLPGKPVRRPSQKILRQVRRIARSHGFAPDDLHAYESDAGRLLRLAGGRRKRREQQLFVCVESAGGLGRLANGRRASLPKSRVLVLRADASGVFALRTYVSR
ncbi:MAG: C25 family cysteine peptidase [Xanthobacteraceae bacterium]